MEDLLLSVHVLAAIVFVGGSAVATSLFPRYAPVSVGVPSGPTGSSPAASGEDNRAVAATLHRITRGYGVIGIVVPVAGMILASVQGRMGEIWITISIVLTAVAGVLLAVQIAPRQREALSEPGDGTRLRSLSILASVYNLLWAVVVVPMIVRPGSGA